MLGSVAALVAGGVILATGWTPIDPLLSILVAAIIVQSGWRVASDAGHILLEGAPQSSIRGRSAPTSSKTSKAWRRAPRACLVDHPEPRMVTLHAVICENQILTKW